MEPSNNPCPLLQLPYSAFLLLVPTDTAYCSLVIDMVLPKSGSEENHLPKCISHNVLCNFPLEISCSFHNCFQKTRITISSRLIYRKLNVPREIDVWEWEIFFLIYFVFCGCIKKKSSIQVHTHVHTSTHKAGQLLMEESSVIIFLSSKSQWSSLQMWHYCIIVQWSSYCI